MLQNGQTHLKNLAANACSEFNIDNNMNIKNHLKIKVF